MERYAETGEELKTWVAERRVDMANVEPLAAISFGGGCGCGARFLKWVWVKMGVGQY